ncbi:glycosyltransferase [Nitrosomonas halophila]|jgi:trehalose synthase|uniref:Trehalose synthase n=1 Tax=Nitrosomonas halophila TaxID=44576 RepID=A0A1H3EVT1_9PROT|nr:glycosyltransferase [Nitrosomonas halophila]SDX82034.1 trehalose synthase [Nitrosomonas halophila]
MSHLLQNYGQVAGEDVIRHLQKLALPLRGLKMVHVNSTRVGGGVAEILEKLVPLTQELGIDVRWEVMSGSADFYQCTKSMHNALQGNNVPIPRAQLDAYERTNATNAEQLRPLLEEADLVFIHDPQPAPLLALCPNRRGKWIWRCHIDISHPYRPVWKYLRDYVAGYDASVFSLPTFAQALPHCEFIIPPSIDPLSDKNIELPEEEISDVLSHFKIDPARPLVVQVSRFDRFKDPVGVINAYRLAKRYLPHLQLALAGGGASDDPEGEIVLNEVRMAAENDADIHILMLPPDAHRMINALQRAAAIVLQKSTREGFGLTVTEALWKGKPVIGGNTGGIRLQVIDHHTGFLVNTPEGAALRLRYLLRQPKKIQSMGYKAQAFVRENFLLTRQLREYLTLCVDLLHGVGDRIELS